jgi:uncharacterized protein YbbC (DUF1343 family)
MQVKLGIDRVLEEELDVFAGQRVGLITNPTGVNRDLVSTVDLLRQHPDVELVALFGPEHGARGEVQDGLAVEAYTDPATRLPVYSLYGKTNKPTREMVAGLDALAFDIQDVGVRFYTYLSTLVLGLEAAAEYGLRFVVLDRPNPITGVKVEGNLLDPAFQSFVGCGPLPIRHGLTLGELALFFNDELEIRADLTVVPLAGWTRDQWSDETSLAWIPPSPNMPTLDTATVYPGTCLFEGTNLSEGRGTTQPFEWIGAPWIDGAAWARELNDLDLLGVRFRPVTFVPTFSKFTNEICQGVQVHVRDRDRFEPVRTGLTLLATARRRWPDHFEWKPGHFDRLMGTDQVRLALEQGAAVEAICARWEAAEADFVRRSREYWLY